MEGEAPAIFVALEHSGAAAAIRQSVWLYPLANVGHILGLVVFVSAVTVMDLRLIGAFAATRPADIVFPARRVAIGAFLLQAATGSMLFMAEASHIVVNPVFQVKLVLIVLALMNVLLVGRLSRASLEGTPPNVTLPARLRVAAALSLTLWFSVAAAGRLIAYV